jgi:hypothetical protein
MNSEAKVARGQIVMTHGPWSNGHQEQTAIVTHVYGQGVTGSLVNLHVFMDEGMSLVESAVPWYPTLAEGLERVQLSSQRAGARFCYFPQPVDA